MYEDDESAGAVRRRRLGMILSAVTAVGSSRCGLFVLGKLLRKELRQHQLRLPLAACPRTPRLTLTGARRAVWGGLHTRLAPLSKLTGTSMECAHQFLKQ